MYGAETFCQKKKEKKCLIGVINLVEQEARIIFLTKRSW